MNSIQHYGALTELRHSLGTVLIDLSGRKLFQPEWSHFNLDKNIYGASLSKLVPLLSFFNLRTKLEQFSKRLTRLKGPLSKKEFLFYVRRRTPFTMVPYPIEKLFTIFPTAHGHHIQFSRTIRKELIHMIRHSNNRITNQLIQKIGPRFMRKTVDALGFYDFNKKGGLWFGRYYGKEIAAWERDPLNNLSHSVSAHSVGLFLIKMAQNQLINPKVSQDIKEVMSNSRFHWKFILGLKRMGIKVNSSQKDGKKNRDEAFVFRKSGTFLNYGHDAALIERNVCKEKKSCENTQKLRYVAVVVSQDFNSPINIPDIITKYDVCIRKNNKGFNAVVSK